MSTIVARIRYGHIDVDRVKVFYRESVPDQADALVLLLLHGFPSASHQFRRLIDVLGARYRLIAPDYPGLGHTEVPDGFAYSFDRLADITEGFVQRLGLSRFVMYMFDFGAPVGFRLAERHPEWIAGLIIQNGNAYLEGLSDAARDFVALRPPFFPEPGARAYLRDLPDAELHLLDTGHFALEENLPAIAPLIAGFLDRTWA